jgi:hypothetical protein
MSPEIPGYIIDDCVKHLPCDGWYESNSFVIPRNTKDTHGEPNNHGKALISMCSTLDIHIVNVRIGKDINGETHLLYW